MCRKMNQTGVFILCVGLVLVTGSPVFAVKQEYPRTYQKKNIVVQERVKTFLKKDLPNSQAYLEVSRKKPEIRIDYQPTEAVFQTDQEKTSCQDAQGMGCTGFAVDFSAQTDCNTSQIVLKVREIKPLTIEIPLKYPKGTCAFDAILKHELSHAAVYKNILSSFLSKTGQNLILEYERLQQGSKRCKNIQEQISSLVSQSVLDYQTAVAAENAKLDNEDGSHPYALEQCAETVKNE